MKVLGMGNALLDVLTQVPDDTLLELLQLPKGSMTLIDEPRMRKIENEIGKYTQSKMTGGSAANTIHGLNRLGVTTGFIGSVGKDDRGDFYHEEMSSLGITPVFDRSDNPSGVANGIITPDKERTFATYLGAALDLTADFLDPEWFKDWDLFYIEGYLVQNHDLIRSALRMAHEAGCLVALDLASYNVVEQELGFLREVIPLYVDLIFANQEEAKAYTGLDNPQKALKKLLDVSRMAVVKIGARGAWAGSETQIVPGAPFQAHLVDTTGAGDLFAAGFIYGMIKNQKLSVCAEWGNLLASKVIEVIGSKITDHDWEVVKTKIDHAIRR